MDLKIKLQKFTATSDIVTFTYTSTGVHRVTSISPDSASPVEKGTLTITGTGFGTDKSLIQVFLDEEVSAGQRTPKYELFVLSVTDTEVKATLSGGVVGDFYVRVFHKTLGNNLDNTKLFRYLIEITDIQPTSGSTKGGQTLTITGRHFSATPSDNQAYVEYSLTDTFLGCAVISSTTTEIKCKVPPKTAGIAGVASVAVEGRLQEEALCSVAGGCKYTYDPALTGSLADDGLELSYRNG